MATTLAPRRQGARVTGKYTAGFPSKLENDGAEVNVCPLSPLLQTTCVATLDSRLL